MEPTPRALITLTTDFGRDSPYVAQMKGVILSRNPEAQIVDISHGIAPQDVREGALVLADVCHRFPPRTIHLCVVDPGVGTDRRVLFAQVGNQRFLAPDNGLITLIARRTPPKPVVAVTKKTYFLPTVSPTFHGRDIFAPVAAHLSLGLSPKRLGEVVTSWVELPFSAPSVGDRRVTGQVMQIDAFGNLITNIEAAHLAAMPPDAAARVTCRTLVVHGLSTTYGQHAPGSCAALWGSSGRLEIAVVQGNAAEQIDAPLDAIVEVTW